MGSGGLVPPFLTSALDGNSHCIGDCVGPSAGLEALE
jgi:hypothetical protein